MLMWILLIMSLLGEIILGTLILTYAYMQTQKLILTIAIGALIIIPCLVLTVIYFF